MKKDFITVSPESGQENGSVTIIADPNPFANDRSTNLLVRTAGDKSQEVRILQNSMPFYTVSLIKFYVYPKKLGTLYLTLDFGSVKVGTNDDGSNYPIYDCGIRTSSSNYDFSSNIKYFLMCTFRKDLLDLLKGYELELKTPSESSYLTLKNSINELGLENYEGEIFLGNGIDIVDKVSLRFTNKTDIYDYRILYQIVFS